METLLGKGVPDIDYYSDYQIKTAGRIFYVHKVLLALKSEKFEQIFSNNSDHYEMSEDEEITRLFLCQFYIDKLQKPVVIISKENNKRDWKTNKENIVDDTENKTFESLQQVAESKNIPIDTLFHILRLCEEYKCTNEMIMRCQHLVSNKINYENYMTYLNDVNSIISSEAKRIEKLLLRPEIKNIYDQLNAGNRVFCKDDKLLTPVQSIGINCRNNCGCGFTCYKDIPPVISDSLEILTIPTPLNEYTIPLPSLPFD